MPNKKFPLCFTLRRLLSQIERSCKGFTLIELLVVVAITVTSGFVLLPKLVDYKVNQDLDDQGQKIQSFIKQAQNYSLSGYQCGDYYAPNQKAIDWHLVFFQTSFYIEPECANHVNIPKTLYNLPGDLIITQIYFDDPSVVGSTQNGGFGSKISFSNITAQVSFRDQDGIFVVNKPRMVLVVKSKTSNSQVNIFMDKGGLIYTGSLLIATPTP